MGNPGLNHFRKHKFKSKGGATLPMANNHMKTPTQTNKGNCTCKPGKHRDNCPLCEGTGYRKDFAAIRAKKPQPTGKPDPRPVATLATKAAFPGGEHPLDKVWKMLPPVKPEPPVNEYDRQAQTFLTSHGIKLRATLSNSKVAPWAGEETGERSHWRVTLSSSNQQCPICHQTSQDEFCQDCIARNVKNSRRLVFDFWGSIKDAEDGKEPTAYDILACISSDAYTPETFAEFCGEFGYEADSIKALQTFRRVSNFAKRLREFFTTAELEALSGIR